MHCLQEEGLHHDLSGGYTAEHQGGYTVLVKCRKGLFLVNVNDMYVGVSLMLYGEFSQEEVDIMQLNLQPNSTVVDVGANIGAFTVPLAHAVPQGRVLAFEPQRVVEQMLSANIQLNAPVNVDIRRVVVGGRGGCSSVRIPETNPVGLNNFGGVSLEPMDGGGEGGGGERRGGGGGGGGYSCIFLFLVSSLCRVLSLRRKIQPFI